MKRANLWVIQVEEGEETQEKSIENIFNKIIKENFPNLMFWELLQPIDFKIPTHFVCGPMHYKCRWKVCTGNLEPNPVAKKPAHAFHLHLEYMRPSPKWVGILKAVDWRSSHSTYLQKENLIKIQEVSQAVVGQNFNPSTWEVKAGG